MTQNEMHKTQLEGYTVGVAGETVNLLSKGSGGSTPSPSTNLASTSMVEEPIVNRCATGSTPVSPAKSDRGISVVIPCHNYAKYIGSCIDSVMVNDYPNIEIIVVIDGGEDNSLDAALTRDVTVLYNETNHGCSYARNRGTEYAKGPFIMQLDADDMIPPYAITEFMKMAQEGYIAQMAYKSFGNEVIYHPVYETNYNQLLKFNTIFNNSVFHKNDWEKAGRYDEGEVMRLGYEDWDLWIRMMKNGCKLRASQEVGLFYRQHGTSLTTKAHANHDRIHKYMLEKNL